MSITYVFAGIPVGHRDASAAWYERLVGQPPDLIPNDDEAAWRLTDTGWIYIILVDDLDAFLAGLAERGIAAEPVEIIGEAVRSTHVTDPDGNRLQIGQP